MKKLLKRLKQDERGLTLVELLAVIVILGIVGVIAFVAIGNVIENSRKDAQIANAQQVISAAKLYEASNTEITSELTTSDSEFANLVGTVRDPWDNNELTVTVNRDSDELAVQITDSKNCEIKATESELQTKDRDELCNVDS